MKHILFAPLRVLFSVVGLLMSAALVSPAAIISTFTDRATFDGSVGPNTIEDFNSFGSEVPFHTIPLDAGLFTVFMTGSPSTSSPRNSIDLPPLQFAEFNVDGTTVANILTGVGSSLFLDFDAPILGFGADFAALNNNTLLTQIIVDGEVVTPPWTVGDQVRFFGFETDTPFSTVEFRGISNDGYGMDNVAFVQISPDIISFGSGELTFGDTTPGATYTVEWAPALTGSWNSSWSSLTFISTTGGTVTVDVPMFYRVVIDADPPPPLVTPDMVGVGHVGNPDDPSPNGLGGNSGAVAYPYKIGRHEVTNTEYTEFLNAVDPTGLNTLGLYNADMETGTFGGITFNGGNPDESKYTVKAGFAIKPVNHVSFYDAMRFCNWLHNGALSGGSTENGAYTLLGGTAEPSNGTNVLRTAGAKFVVPSDDEWYKAAYYEPGGDADNYWLYPTRGNTTPNESTPPGPAPAANFNLAVGFLTDAGAYSTTAGFYGTFDMAGNVWEWTETIFETSRALRGGSWSFFPVYLQSDRPFAVTPDSDDHGLGFRVASP